jgi:uncharacterized protein
MKQLIVISDSHGRNEVFEQLRQAYPDAEAYIHCGDSECPPSELKGFISVKGNNDIFYDYPEEVRLNIDGLKILVIHSHQYPIIVALDRLKAKCSQEQIDLCLFGHSHIYRVARTENCVLVNPGSIHYNRDGSEPSYAVITLNQHEIEVERKTMPRQQSKRRWF